MSEKIGAAVSALCLVLLLGVWFVKVPSVQETFAQADAHKAAQEVANGR